MKISSKEYQRQRYAKNRAKGLCTCGRERVEGLKTCAGCKEKQDKYRLKHPKRNIEKYKKAKQEKLKNLKDPEYMRRINEKIRIGLEKGL